MRMVHKKLDNYRPNKDREFFKVSRMSAINTIQKEFQYDAEKMEEVFGERKPEGFVDKPVDPDELIACVFGAILE